MINSRSYKSELLLVFLKVLNELLDNVNNVEISYQIGSYLFYGKKNYIDRKKEKYSSINQ